MPNTPKDCLGVQLQGSSEIVWPAATEVRLRTRDRVQNFITPVIPRSLPRETLHYGNSIWALQFSISESISVPAANQKFWSL